jgi:hypothetical protein
MFNRADGFSFKKIFFASIGLLFVCSTIALAIALGITINVSKSE